MNQFTPLPAGTPVYQITNPGCRGVTTGQVRRSGTRTYVGVQIEVNNIRFIEDLWTGEKRGILH